MAAQQMLVKMALAELRKAAGPSQTELARMLGVSQANLSKLESTRAIFRSARCAASSRRLAGSWN